MREGTATSTYARAAGKLRRLEPTMITFTATISTCVKGRRPERVLELLAEMQGRALEHTVITFNAAISAYEKRQRLERKPEMLSTSAT